MDEQGLKTPLVVQEKNEMLCEFKKQLYIAWPLVIVNLLIFGLSMISLIFVGHLGELARSTLVLRLLIFLLLSLVLACWGATLANAVSLWINVLLLAVYVCVSPSCKKTWKGFSKEAFNNIPTFVKLAVPSAVMVCLEIWSFKMMVLLSGLLPNPQLETSVLSISMNTCSMIYMIPLGLSGATSVRVSNALGAGWAQAARLAIRVSMFFVVIEGVLGAVRGCGRQKIGAIVNLGSYYLIGIPLAILFAFVFNIGGKGLWLGIIATLLTQAFFLSILMLYTDWEKEDDVVTYAINGLSHKYERLAQIITHKDPFPDLATMRSMVSTEEMRLRSKSPIQQTNMTASAPQMLLATSNIPRGVTIAIPAIVTIVNPT
nr:multi antimicrobial extrusion protein [Tanacetum cinerariifolium]